MTQNRNLFAAFQSWQCHESIQQGLKKGLGIASRARLHVSQTLFVPSIRLPRTKSNNETGD